MGDSHFQLERRELRGDKCVQSSLRGEETDIFWCQRREVKLMGTHSGQFSAQEKKKKITHS